MEKEKNTALGGIRVLDLADEKGAYCTKLLADLGADVIKVEPPGGDRTRNIGPFYHDEADPEKSLFFFQMNTNKKSITLNIETTDGREILKRLVRTADILVETFPVGYLKQIELDYSVLKEINPGLVLTSITPFGQTGPHKDYKGSDLIGMATGGLMSLIGFPEDPPSSCGGYQAYHCASVHASVGTLIALYGKELRGTGRHVDISVQEAVVLTILQTGTQYWEVLKQLNKRPGNEFPFVIRGAQIVYACKDGWISFPSYNTTPPGMGWDELVKWMDSEGMAGDLIEEKWHRGDHEFVMMNTPHVVEFLKPFVKNHNKKELYEKFQAMKIPAMPANTPADALDDEQLKARGFFVQVNHPELQDILTYLGPPYRLSETPWRIASRAPLIGEHNAEIYEKELGFSKDQVTALKTAGHI
jgi:benzylsuccinate CoA-transferase BbsE subunit